MVFGVFEIAVAIDLVEAHHDITDPKKGLVPVAEFLYYLEIKKVFIKFNRTLQIGNRYSKVINVFNNYHASNPFLIM
jgi:hypothetical protein